MARRDSLILGTSVVSGITMRRESLVGGGCGGGDSRRNSLILPDYYGRSSIPVMEVEPWELSHNVQEVGYAPPSRKSTVRSYLDCQQIV